MSVKHKTHFAISVKGGSFISVCRPGWDYDKNIDASFTEKETDVTCGKCLRCLKNWGYEKPMHKKTSELLERISE